jgi:hypothetical protein
LKTKNGGFAGKIGKQQTFEEMKTNLVERERFQVTRLLGSAKLTRLGRRGISSE